MTKGIGAQWNSKRKRMKMAWRRGNIQKGGKREAGGNQYKDTEGMLYSLIHCSYYPMYCMGTCQLTVELGCQEYKFC